MLFKQARFKSVILVVFSVAASFYCLYVDIREVLPNIDGNLLDREVLNEVIQAVSHQLGRHLSPGSSWPSESQPL